MFKTVITLMRGSAAAAAENLTDTHALLILDQQMRDARSCVEQARRALAVAMAESAQEDRRNEATAQRIAGLETRARAALAGDREALATEAAEAIADLLVEQAAGRQARTLFATEISQDELFRKHGKPPIPS